MGKSMTKHTITILLLSSFYACGGGGSSTPDPINPAGETGTGSGYSVPGSFQPVDSE